MYWFVWDMFSQVVYENWKTQRFVSSTPDIALFKASIPAQRHLHPDKHRLGRPQPDQSLSPARALWRTPFEASMTPHVGPCLPPAACSDWLPHRRIKHLTWTRHSPTMDPAPLAFPCAPRWSLTNLLLPPHCAPLAVALIWRQRQHALCTGPKLVIPFHRRPCPYLQRCLVSADPPPLHRLNSSSTVSSLPPLFFGVATAADGSHCHSSFLVSRPRRSAWP
jgi:hypothetical protein